jgi:DNA-binding NtrC family response regulator
MRTNKHNNKIFIVEDDKFYAQLIQSFLEGSGFKDTSIFYSGFDCLNHMEEKPNIVILDYTLGLENGLMVLQKIKELQPSCKVIMLSGQEFLHVSVKAFKYGASDYIEKNKDSLKNLEISIDKVLSQKGGENSILQAVFSLLF